MVNCLLLSFSMEQFTVEKRLKSVSSTEHKKKFMKKKQQLKRSEGKMKNEIPCANEMTHSQLSIVVLS